VDWADLWAWLAGTAWRGVPGVPTLIWQHLVYSGVPTVAAIVIAVPFGLWTGHTGRGGLVAINISNVGRAVPSLGVLILVFVVSGFGLLPVYVTLIALALPPILTNTHVGIRQVDPEVLDAAAGMGLTGRQQLWQVEIPLALPVIMAGIRTAAVQVVATATLAAIVGLDGLGRPIVSGLAQNVQASPEARTLVIVGAVLVALLAVATELALGAAERAVARGTTSRTPGGVGEEARIAT
jgi:osmoprotectant transport system permease protein